MFRRGGHRAIPGYRGLRMRSRTNDCQGTTVYLTRSADRAILFTYDISLWDLKAACVLSRFTPDVPVSARRNLFLLGLLRDVICEDANLHKFVESAELDCANYSNNLF